MTGQLLELRPPRQAGRVEHRFLRMQQPDATPTQPASAADAMEDRYQAIRVAAAAAAGPTATSMLVVKAVCDNEVRRIPILNKVPSCRRPCRECCRSRGPHWNY